MLDAAALLVVALTALYFVGFGLLSLVAPDLVGTYLLAFGGSALRHFAELAIRLVVGSALILAARQLPWPGVFTGAGWLLVATTLCLAFVPWRIHHRFARALVSSALRYLPLVGGVAIFAGLALITALYAGAV